MAERLIDKLTSRFRSTLSSPDSNLQKTDATWKAIIFTDGEGITHCYDALDYKNLSAVLNEDTITILGTGSEEEKEHLLYLVGESLTIPS